MKATRITFEVTGRGYFPTDMLRYDGCYPRDPSSASRIAEHHREMVSVQLQSERQDTIGHGPTEARWNSFGWFVDEVERS